MTSEQDIKKIREMMGFLVKQKVAEKLNKMNSDQKKIYNAKEILQKADGKKNYQKIAEELKINTKITSPALSLAKDLGFAEKIKPGIYKKITKNMKYIPNKKKENKNI